MLRLCGHKSAVEELARKDDLTLLFSAISSVCPKHNVIWRKTSGDVLLTISRYSLSQPVISYLHNKEQIHNLSKKFSSFKNNRIFVGNSYNEFTNVIDASCDSNSQTCIAMCIENMQRSTQSSDNSPVTDLAPLEIVEMLVTIFCFLKDSSTNSQTLLDDFKSCQGYIFLSEFLLKLEQVVEFTLEISLHF